MRKPELDVKGDAALVRARHPDAVAVRNRFGAWVVRDGPTGPALGHPSANRRGAWLFAARIVQAQART